MIIKARLKGTPIEEMMRWRRGTIVHVDGQRLIGYRKMVLGEPEYRYNGVELDSALVFGFIKMEAIIQPHEQFDPQG